MNSINSSPITSRVTCSNCLTSLTSSTHCIKCSDPTCHDLLLCLACFCSGSQPAPHRATHPYSVHIVGISPGWSLEEDLSLLEVMEQCGYGSWEEVARLLPGRTRSPQDIKHHFDTVFVNGKTTYLQMKENSFTKVNTGACQPSQVQYFPVVCPDRKSVV